MKTKIKILSICLLTSLLFAGCNALSRSAYKTVDITENMSIKEPSHAIDSEYLEWAMYEEGEINKFNYIFQIPRITINTDVTKDINAEIESRFLKIANDYLEDPFLDIKIETEYLINDEIISIKILYFATNYGTDGEIYTVNYSIKYNTVLPFSYVLQENNITHKELLDKINDVFNDKYYEYIDTSSFYINKEGESIVVVIALEHPQGCEPWKHIYYYNINKKEAVKY